MITGRIDQIAFGNRKQTNKHTRGRRENPPLSADPCGPSHQFVATTGTTQCAPATVLKKPGASPQSCDRPPQKNAKLPIAGPASTRAGGGWTKPTVLKL